jgi:hypothetical protein
LQQGKRRFGKVTNNAAENMNSAFLNLHAQPVIDLTCNIIDWILNKKHERFQKASTWMADGHMLTAFAQGQVQSLLLKGRTLRVALWKDLYSKQLSAMILIIPMHLFCLWK